MWGLEETEREGERERERKIAQPQQLLSYVLTQRHFLPWKKEVGEKNPKMVCFAASTWGLTSLKKVNFAGFGYSWFLLWTESVLNFFFLKFSKLRQEF